MIDGLRKKGEKEEEETIEEKKKKTKRKREERNEEKNRNERYCPAGQVVHTDMPVRFVHDPTGQAVAADKPIKLQKVLTSHTLGCNSPRQYDPDGHEMIVLTLGQYEPYGQLRRRMTIPLPPLPDTGFEAKPGDLKYARIHH